MEKLLKHLEREALRKLIDVSRTVSSSLDLHEVLTRVTHTATDTMRVKAASLLLVERESGDLFFEVAEGEKAEAVRRIVVPMGKGIAGWVAAHRRSLIVNDVASDGRFTGWVDEMTGFTTRAILCVPLLYREKLLGVMEVINKVDGTEFTDGDLRLCESMGSLAAIAIDNAQIHAEQVRSARLAAIGQTMAGLAHCIKNILNAVQGGSYIVDLGLKDHDEEKLVKGWQIVKRNSAFLGELVLNMLTYSKEREPSYCDADLSEISQRVVELVSESAQRRNVRLRWESGGEAVVARIDPVGIRRVLMNLVSNAVEACPDNGDGEVCVRADVRETNQVVIQISDNGCGIAPENRSKLFHEFFSTKGSRGTGLGLAVSHKIVSEHKGRIEVDSMPGQGTTFTILLPRRPSEVRAR